MKFGNEFWLILYREYINPNLFAVCWLFLAASGVTDCWNLCCYWLPFRYKDIPAVASVRVATAGYLPLQQFCCCGVPGVLLLLESLLLIVSPTVAGILLQRTHFCWHFSRYWRPCCCYRACCCWHPCSCWLPCGCCFHCNCWLHCF